jgi:hypothetical protein
MIDSFHFSQGNFAGGPLMLYNNLPSIQFFSEWSEVLEHPNMIMVPYKSTRPLTWPCFFEEYLAKVMEQL